MRRGAWIGVLLCAAGAGADVGATPFDGAYLPEEFAGDRLLVHWGQYREVWLRCR